MGSVLVFVACHHQVGALIEGTAGPLGAAPPTGWFPGAVAHGIQVFGGSGVCQIAFLALTGISKCMVAQCRDMAVEGKQSFLSAREMGLHASLRKPDGGKVQTYLSARQWLEQYADTHAEMSPMDEKAHLPAGRKMFYYYQYRGDMIERSEATLGRKVPEETSLGSIPGQTSGLPAPPPPPGGPHEETPLGSIPGQTFGLPAPPPPSAGPHHEPPPPPPPAAAQRGRKRKSLGVGNALGSTPRCSAEFADGVCGQS